MPSLKEDEAAPETEPHCQTATTPTTDESTSMPEHIHGDADMDGVRHLFLHYVGQLLHGCGDQNCTEILCHTGRLNTTRRPIRKYTPRAARAIALRMCGSPHLRSHLCKHYRPGEAVIDNAVQSSNSPRDHSSMLQLLCDTSSIKSLADATKSVPLDDELLELGRMHTQLEGLFQVAGRLPHLSGKDVVSNTELAKELSPCISWLLSKAPLTRLAPWTLVNRDFIGKGIAVPQKIDNIPTDERFNTWLVILDALSHEPYLRLLARVVQILARRRALTKALASVDRSQQHRFHKPSQSVTGLVAADLYSDDIDATTRVLAVIVWLKKLFTKHWDGNPIIQYGSICHGVLDMITNIFWRRNRLRAALPPDAFLFPVIASNISMLDLSESYVEFVARGSAKEQHVFGWNILFSVEQLSRYVRTINHLTMREAHSYTEKTLAIRRRSIRRDLANNKQIQHAEQHYLLLNVRRLNVLRDVFDQLWQRRKQELRRPLRVRLGEADALEIGHDLGGVQIEFFNLVCREIFSEQAQMFTTDPTTGYSYFKVGSLQPLYMFELFGLLVALAVYNGITLPITLPRIFYVLLSQNPSFSPTTSTSDPVDLMDGWPTVARSLQSILKTHVPGLDFSYPIEANGLRLAAVSTLPSTESNRGRERLLAVNSATEISNGRPVDLESFGFSWPGWKVVRAETDPLEVTPESRNEYIRTYIHHLCYGSVAPQWDAFYKGFYSSGIIDHHTLILLSPPNLKTYIEGSPRLDINDLKAATRYDGFDPNSKYMHWFWRIVTSWPELRQKQLLKFVTAAERIPISGASNLTFIIKKSLSATLDSLPTSSTCFGTLMLPRYSTAEVLASKLKLAVEYGAEGFGTG